VSQCLSPSPFPSFSPRRVPVIIVMNKATSSSSSAPPLEPPPGYATVTGYATATGQRLLPPGVLPLIELDQVTCRPSRYPSINTHLEYEITDKYGNRLYTLRTSQDPGCCRDRSIFHLVGGDRNEVRHGKYVQLSLFRRCFEYRRLVPVLAHAVAGWPDGQFVHRSRYHCQPVIPSVD